jgi:2-phosphoglycerate kinase
MRCNLEHIFWIGGSPCSGKSSVADLLGKRYGIETYRCDGAYDRHVQSASLEAHPNLSEVGKMTWNQLWTRPLGTMVDQEFLCYEEEFPMIVEDLCNLDGDKPLIAEGTALMPKLVVPLLKSPTQAVWIVPSEQFQRQNYQKRSYVAPILATCQDPSKAFDNWMSRDIRFGKIVAAQAKELGQMVILNDGSRTASDIASQVAHRFGLDQGEANGSWPQS